LVGFEGHCVYDVVLRVYHGVEAGEMAARIGEAESGDDALSFHVAARHPVDKTPGEYYAVEITWTYILFYMAVLRYNMRTRPCTEAELALVGQVEEALREAIRGYSKPYAHAILPYLEGALYCENPHLMQYMEYINYQHIYRVRYSTPKNAFSYLARYMTGSIYDSFHYNDILQYLKRVSKRLGCDISQLSYNYDLPPYDFEW